MLRQLVSQLAVRDVLPSSVAHQQVRWRHKPRWLPVAKTKVFRVPERQRLPPDEAEELKRLFNVYRTQMKSLREYFAERTKAMSTGEEVLAEIARREEEADREAVRVNEEWNRQVAGQRESALAAAAEAEALEILEALQRAKIASEEMKARAEEIVRREKERAKHYITPDNIEEAVARALDNQVDLEFAIDLHENIYAGRRSKVPINEQPDDKQAATA